MKVRKSVSAKTKALGLTPKRKQRLGRPPKYLTPKQLQNPSGFIEPEPKHLLSTLEIIHGVLSKKRDKFGAVLAGKADEAAVARQNKRLQRVRKRMTQIDGIQRVN